MNAHKNKNLTNPLVIFEKPQFVSFRTDELSTPGLTNRKLGQSFKAVINFEVVERTKSFATLKLNFVDVQEKKRVY